MMFALNFPPQVPKEIFLVSFQAVVIPALSADGEQSLFREHLQNGNPSGLNLDENAVWSRFQSQQVTSGHGTEQNSASIVSGAVVLSLNW